MDRVVQARLVDYSSDDSDETVDPINTDVVFDATTLPLQWPDKRYSPAGLRHVTANKESRSTGSYLQEPLKVSQVPARIADFSSCKLSAARRVPPGHRMCAETSALAWSKILYEANRLEVTGDKITTRTDSPMAGTSSTAQSVVNSSSSPEQEEGMAVSNVSRASEDHDAKDTKQKSSGQMSEQHSEQEDDASAATQASTRSVAASRRKRSRASSTETATKKASSKSTDGKLHQLKSVEKKVSTKKPNSTEAVPETSRRQSEPLSDDEDLASDDAVAGVGSSRAPQTRKRKSITLNVAPTKRRASLSERVKKKINKRVYEYQFLVPAHHIKDKLQNEGIRLGGQALNDLYVDINTKMVRILAEAAAVAHKPGKIFLMEDLEQALVRRRLVKPNSLLNKMKSLLPSQEYRRAKKWSTRRKDN